MQGQPASQESSLNISHEWKLSYKSMKDNNGKTGAQVPMLCYKFRE